MKNTDLIEHRRVLDQTQAEMAQLLGCSLIGYKRFESGARPLPPYIAQTVKTFLFCQSKGFWIQLKKVLVKLEPVRINEKPDVFPADRC